MDSKNIRSLMESYLEVYSEKYEEEEKNEKESEESEDSEKEVEKKGKKEKEERGEKEDSEEKMKESYEDVIISYLLDEGFADNETSAYMIANNMSEEWINIVLEAKYGTKEGRHKLAMKIKKGEEVGKSGKGTGFASVEKQAKKYGASNPKAVAAAAMWKTYGK